MIKEYELYIEKLNDHLQNFISIKVPLNYSIIDVKYELDKNFGLRLKHQILYCRNKQLNDSDKLTTIYENEYNDRNSTHRLNIKLSYNYDSEEELAKKFDPDFSQNRNIKNKEHNLNTHFINQGKELENRGDPNSYRNNRATTHVPNNQHNSYNQNNLIQKKRPREESSNRDYYSTYSKRQSTEDFNPWNSKKQSTKGMFSSNYKIYNEDLHDMQDDEGPNDFDKLKNLLDFDKQFFKMPKMTFDESKLIVSMRERNKNQNRAHEDKTTKKIYDLCEKFLSESFIDYNKIPTVVIELPTNGRKSNILEKEEILDIRSKVEENDDYINNVEDLIAKLSESQLKSEKSIGTEKEIAIIDIVERYENKEEYEEENKEDEEDNKEYEEEYKEDEEENKEDQLVDPYLNNNNNNGSIIIQNNFETEYIIQEVIEKEITENELDKNLETIDRKSLLSVEQEFNPSNYPLIEKKQNNFAEIIRVDESIIIEEQQITHNNLKDPDDMIIEDKNEVANLISPGIEPVDEFNFHNLHVRENELNSRSHTREDIKKQFESIYQSRKQTKDITNFIKNLEHFNIIIDDVKIDSSFIMMNPKLNIVLDLDSTLIFSKCNETKYDEINEEIDIFQEEIRVNTKVFYTTIKIRPYVKEFLTKIKNYTNFYINTHGVYVYGKRIAEIIEKLCNINIPVENIRGKTHDFKSLGQFNPNNKFLEKSIIIDDTIGVWEMDKSSRHVLINSMRYVSFIQNKKLTKPEFKMLQNYVMNYELNITDIKKEKSYREPINIDHMFNDEHLTPLCAEYNHSTKYQMKYLAEFIEKVYKLVTITNCILLY